MKKIMKLTYKKMLAFVLVFVMLTGTVGTIGDVKAAEPTEIEFNAVDAVNWWNAADGENAYALFLKADQELTSSYYTGIKYEVSDGTTVKSYEFNAVGIYNGMFNMRVPYEALPNPNEMKASGKTYILTFKAGNIVSATNTTVNIKKDFSIVIKDGSVLGILDTIHTGVTYVAGDNTEISIWTTPTTVLSVDNYHKVVSGSLRYGNGSAAQTTDLEGIWCFKDNDTNYYYMPLPTAVTDSITTGTIVVFDNVIVQDAVETKRFVRLPNLCYQYTQDASPRWQVVDEPKDITYTAMDLKFYSSNNDEDKTYWDMYFDTDAEIPGTNNSTQFVGVQATVGDKVISDLIVKKSTTQLLSIFTMDTTTLPIPPEKGTVLTIKKGKYKDTTGTCGIEIKNDYSLTWDGEEWSTQPLVQTNKVTIKDIMTSGYNQESNRWNVYVTVDGTIPGENFAVNFEGLKCYVNDKEISLPEVCKYNDALFFYIVDSELPSNFKGNTNIVLKAGTTTVSDSNINPIEIAEDFTIYANEYAWRTDEFCVPVNAKVTGVAGFPLSVDNAWSMTFSLDSDVPSAGVAWQTYYNGPAVLIDGKEYQIGLQKTENTKQVAIYEPSLNNANVKDGTEVTIQAGVYTSSTTRDAIKITEDYTVVFDENKGNYGYDNWQLSIANTKVEGDVNGDKAARSNDIIRLMRYLDDTQNILINRTAADANRDGVINKKDLVTLRKLLVGRLSYTDSEDGMPTGTPYYNNSDKIIRMAHVCPEPKDFAKYKAAGLNTLNSELVAPVTNDRSPSEQKKVIEYLTEAEKYGLDVLLFSDVINHLLRLDHSIESDNAYKDSWKAIIDQYVDVYSEYSAFAGFVLSDELSIGWLGNYTTVVNYLKEKYPNLILRLPMLPVYTDSGNLTTNTSLTDKETIYKDYVRNFSAPLGCFTYDNYSLYKTNKSGESEKYHVSEDWLNNLKWVSDVAKESSLYTGVTIQTCAGAASPNRYAPTQKSDIGFQIYTAMAFGMQEFGYYTYNPHPTDENTSDSMSENVSVCTAVQSVNQELATFEHVFKSFTWKQTLELASGATNSSTNDGNLTSVQSTSIASYVGCMRDAEGYYGYMVANAEGPRASTNGSVTLTFKNATHAQVYHNGKCETKELTENKLTVDLSVGEGAFVIPYIAK